MSRSPDSPVDLGPPPYPGSDEALAAGCRCPVLDNGHGNTGLACDRGGWVIVVGCPMHAPSDGAARSDDDGLDHVRRLMCSPGGRDHIERRVLWPFGYVMAFKEKGSDVRLPDDEMGG